MRARDRGWTFRILDSFSTGKPLIEEKGFFSLSCLFPNQKVMENQDSKFALGLRVLRSRREVKPRTLAWTLWGHVTLIADYSGRL